MNDDHAQHLRMVEALLFAAEEPLDEKSISARMPDGADVTALVAELEQRYQGRGVNLVTVAGKWAFRTAADLHFLLEEHRQDVRRLSRAALETLAIIAYHQPVTRAEVEEVRGVSLSKGTLDLLMEIGWVKIRGRRRSPGRPLTYGVSDAFLEHFSLATIKDLPGLDELKAAGLLEGEPSLTVLQQRRREAPEEDAIDDDDAASADLETLTAEIAEEEAPAGAD